MKKAVTHGSQRIYRFLLKLYPASFQQEFGEEMQYVFTESLRDAYADTGGSGIPAFWGRTVLDAGTSILAQHVESLKGNRTMNNHITDFVFQNKIFAWIALATGLLLLMPLIAMQFTSEVSWTSGDFGVMGLLVFGIGSLFVIAARKINRKYWAAVALACAAAFLYLWAELAVGIITNWGS
jgi:hypothetical protein